MAITKGKKKRPLLGPEDCRFYGLSLQPFPTDWPPWKNKGKETISSLRTSISPSQIESSPTLLDFWYRKCWEGKKRTYFIICCSCTPAHIQGPFMFQPRPEPSPQVPTGSSKISDWVGILLFLLSYLNLSLNSSKNEIKHILVYIC